MMVRVPGTTLQSSSSNKKMPIMGMGTAAYPFAESDETKAALLTSIKLGYRHFDTASVYHNEKAVGEAISEALKLGLAKSRDEFFINSKLWCSDSHPDRVIPALQESLKKLGLEYLDMYLIHWPLSLKPGSYEFPIPTDEEILPMDFKAVWAAMEECQNFGLTKSIGVSNFSCKKLETILSTAKIYPVVNQVEMNILWQQTKLNKFCTDNGIVLMAFSPLGAQGSPWGTTRVMECKLLHEIAKAKGKTHAQVCLRWIYEQGAGILVKSYNELRMKENLEIFNWKLSAKELKRISELPQHRGFPVDSLLSAKGPFRTEEELWDGEI